MQALTRPCYLLVEQLGLFGEFFETVAVVYVLVGQGDLHETIFCLYGRNGLESHLVVSLHQSHFYLLLELLELATVLDRQEALNVPRVENGGHFDQIIKEKRQNPHSFLDMSDCSFGGFLAGNGRNDLRGEKLPECGSKPNEIAVSPADAPPQRLRADLELQEAGGSEAHQTATELPLGP